MKIMYFDLYVSLYQLLAEKRWLLWYAAKIKFGLVYSFGRHITPVAPFTNMV